MSCVLGTNSALSSHFLSHRGPPVPGQEAHCLTQSLLWQLWEQIQLVVLGFRGSWPTLSCGLEISSSSCGRGWQSEEGSESKMWRNPQIGTWPSCAMSLLFYPLPINTYPRTAGCCFSGSTLIASVHTWQSSAHGSALCWWKTHSGSRIAFGFITELGADSEGQKDKPISQNK